MRVRYNPANPARPHEGDAASLRKITGGPGGSSLNPSWFVFTPDRGASGPLIDSIAFAGPDQDGGESQIHYAEHDRGARPFPAGDRILTFTLTSGPGDDRAPAWSPTGDRIVYQSKRGGHSDIYVMDPFADSERDLNLTQFVGDNANPDWEAPRGRTKPSRFDSRGRRARPRSRRGRVFSGEPPLRLRRQGAKCRKTGTPRNDLLCGTPRRDVLRGKGGDDRILGRGGERPAAGAAPGTTASWAVRAATRFAVGRGPTASTEGPVATTSAAAGAGIASKRGMVSATASPAGPAAISSSSTNA